MAQPRFGREHGLFRSKFLMKITKTDPEAEVRYTTDGSEPTAESTLYTTMLSIESTLILRAAEFKDGVRTSDITTASYIFPLDVLNQPNNPEGYPSTWTGSMPSCAARCRGSKDGCFWSRSPAVSRTPPSS